MADIVRGQIAYADPEGPMKPNLVTGKDAADVALYIAKCSGNPTCGVTAATNAPPPASGGSTTTATTTSSAGAGGGNAEGKKLFTSAGCAGCHTLKDAGASGAVGPNLDTLKPDAARVAHQVEVGGGAMPSFKSMLSAAQIKAVSDYVAASAGK